MDETSIKASKFDDSQALAGEANLDEQAVLATDYLNHFNEIVMLLHMVPDMPNVLEEAKAWPLFSYKEHFEQSRFSAKETAINPYDHLPER